MAGTRAAIRYAKAILDIAQTKGNASEVGTDMKTILDTVNANQELAVFIENPTMSVEKKQNALLEIFSDANSVTKSMFKLLFENKRFELLAPIAEQYNTLLDECKGIVQAEVTTAIAIDANLEAKVLAKIATWTDKKVTITNTVDPSIIGGFILRIGDKQYNASVSNRLKVLKRELSN